MSTHPSRDATADLMTYMTYSSRKALSTLPNAEMENIPCGFGFEFEDCLEQKLQLVQDDLE